MSQVCLPRDQTELVATVSVADWVPLTTKRSYYAGRAPMEHLDGPRVSAEVYRAGGNAVACRLK
jgi:hypothetical protein